MSASGSAVSGDGDPPGQAKHARSIIDISQRKLSDIPFALEEALRKTPGVISVQLNAFSGKLVVEFDPSIISFDKVWEKVICTK